MLKKLYLIVAVASLTACGTGSNNSEDVSSNGGECAKITAKFWVGQIWKLKVFSPDEFFGYSSFEIKEADNEHRVHEIIDYTGDKATLRGDFYTKGNFEYGTKVIDGIKITEFDPHSSRRPVNKVCAGSTWEDTFTAKNYVNGNEIPNPSEKSTEKSKIEGINIAKTVEAGEFNTYILLVERRYKESIILDKTWIDMETGIPVLHEIYNSGKLIVSLELVDYSN